MKILPILVDVNMQRDEVLVYERGYVMIVIGLGVQPSACTS
ncbi:MAG: hypothetical protein ABI646_08095 [Acidobacteriota bacterium]